VPVVRWLSILSLSVVCSVDLLNRSLDLGQSISEKTVNKWRRQKKKKERRKEDSLFWVNWIEPVRVTADNGHIFRSLMVKKVIRWIRPLSLFFHTTFVLFFLFIPYCSFCLISFFFAHFCSCSVLNWEEKEGVEEVI